MPVSFSFLNSLQEGRRMHVWIKPLREAAMQLISFNYSKVTGEGI
jgi:hypothetical protein